MHETARRFGRAITACVMIALSMTAAAAAQPAGRPATPDSTAIPSGTPDIEIIATVRARELRFEQVGNATLDFHASHPLDTVSITQRQNLPEPALPGVTYRDIGIRLTIVSAFADIDRIVAEALGEIPIDDAVQPRREDER